MSDLVERLKKPAPAFGMEYYDPTFDVRQEAAKRIAELEAENAALKRDFVKVVERDRAVADAKQAKRIAELEAALAAIAALDEVSVTDFDQDTHQWRHQKIARQAIS